jgi:hypothetical protein
MNSRWFGSVATLVTCAGLASAQAPLPADWSPPPASAPAAPMMVNGAPAPAVVLQGQTPAVAAVPADVKPVSATTDAAPTTPPAPAPAEAAHVAVNGDVNHGGEPGGYFDNNNAPLRHYWGRAEYLLWWEKNLPLRTVLGTIPNADAALLELPPNAITPRFGNDSVSFGALSGVRLELGVALDEAACWGVSAEFFQLEHATRGASLSSDGTGSPPLGPVFFDPAINRQVIVLFANPGINSGTAGDIVSNRLWGAEIDLRRRLPQLFSDRCDFLLGYRHIGFDESLDAGGTAVFLSGIPSPNSTINYLEHFGVHNNFDGAIVGLESEFDVWRFFLDLRGKFGIGNVHETTSVNGVTNFISTLPGTPSQQFAGGILAQPTNSGNLTRNRIDFLGEITVNAGVRFWDNHAKAYIGYNFLGLSKIARVDQLVGNVDSTIVPSLQGSMRTLGVSQPFSKVDDGRYYVEGLNLGLAFEF